MIWVEDCTLSMKRIPTKDYIYYSPLQINNTKYNTFDNFSIYVDSSCEMPKKSNLNITKSFTPKTQIYITNTQFNDYNKFILKSCIIGTEQWLASCILSNTLSDPELCCLDYPHPPNPIPEFKSFRITITGYPHNTRQSIKAIIENMGGIFSGVMTKDTTHLVCLKRDGDKFFKSKEWGVKVVCCGWVEQCYLKWKHTDLDWYESGPVGSLDLPRSITHSVIDDSAVKKNVKRVRDSDATGNKKQKQSRESNFTLNEQSVVYEPELKKTLTNTQSSTSRESSKQEIIDTQENTQPLEQRPSILSIEENGKSTVSHQTVEPKTKNKSQSIESYQFIFTGIYPKSSDIAAIKQLGGNVAESMDTCTLLIATKISRTLKSLIALNKCIPIVSYNFLTESIKSGYFLNYKRFLVIDKPTEKEYNFKYQKRLATPNVFKDLNFFLLDKCQVGNSLLRSVIGSGGGVVLEDECEGCIVIGDAMNSGGVDGIIHSVESIFSSSLCGMFERDLHLVIFENE